MKTSFKNIEKRFSDLLVIDDFSREMDDGELVALVGPSGCGKSTLLHIAAGLETASSRQILADGRPIEGPHPERTLIFRKMLSTPGSRW
jgi:NitT/TauT family transport system ATP-binding protein